MSKLKAALAVLIILLLVGTPAIAQESESSDTAEETGSTAKEAEAENTGAKNWEFSLGPSYIWLVAHSADITVKGDDADGDVSYGNIFDSTNLGVVFHLEAVRKNSWGLFTGFSYVESNPHDMDFKQIMGEAAAMYRLIEGDLVIDGFGGLRYSQMDVELEDHSSGKDQDQTKDWIDPFFGLKWKWKFAEKWGTNLRADAGGFSIGSKRTFNFVGMLDFKPWQHFEFFAGYRGLYQDHSSGDGGNKFKYTGWLHGPLMGLNITW
jgi:hypothetical protein